MNHFYKSFAETADKNMQYIRNKRMLLKQANKLWNGENCRDTRMNIRSSAVAFVLNENEEILSLLDKKSRK